MTALLSPNDSSRPRGSPSPARLQDAFLRTARTPFSKRLTRVGGARVASETGGEIGVRSPRTVAVGGTRRGPLSRGPPRLVRPATVPSLLRSGPLDLPADALMLFAWRRLSKRQSARRGHEPPCHSPHLRRIRCVDSKRGWQFLSDPAPACPRASPPSAGSWKPSLRPSSAASRSSCTGLEEA